MKILISTLSLLFCLWIEFSYGLYRDNYILTIEGSHDIFSYRENKGICLNCLKNEYFDKFFLYNNFPNRKSMQNVVQKYSHLIPYHQSLFSCGLCPSGNSNVIYKGYFDPYRNRYFDQFERFLEFSSNNPSQSHSFWPETSKVAAEINDLAFCMFYKLLKDTELRSIYTYPDELFFYNEPYYWYEWGFSEYILGYEHFDATIVFVNHSFFFSDYYRICEDLYAYSLRNFSNSACEFIRGQLEEILNALEPYFFKIYEDYLSESFDGFIYEELLFIEDQNLHLKNLHSPTEKNLLDLMTEELCSEMSICSKIKPLTNPGPINSLESSLLVTQAALYNEHLMFSEAITLLTDAIKKNPKNKEAYIERALSYFELGQVDLAIEDYKKAKELVFSPLLRSKGSSVVLEKFYVPENKLEFSNGLIKGSLQGMQVSTREFIPSIYNSCRGILNGLWAFVCSPAQVSQDVIVAAYSMGEFISSHTYQECLECVVPEIRELALSWEKLNDHDRGHKIGYIIGKYGLDIFVPIATVNVVSNVKYLKRANTMCTLESCTISEANKIKIMEESSKRASLRSAFAEGLDPVKINIKCSNVKYHILQKKHLWEKVVTISGNIEEDFKKIVLLLEENCILSEKYLLESEIFCGGKIIRFDYQMKIHSNEIRAIFEKYTETNQIFLKDAWVVK